MQTPHSGFEGGASLLLARVVAEQHDANVRFATRLAKILRNDRVGAAAPRLSPAALTLEGGQGSVVAEVAARGHDKTLRGSLALLEAAMPE